MKRVISSLIIFFHVFFAFGQSSNQSGGFGNNYESEKIQFSTLKIEVYFKNPSLPNKIDTGSATAFIFTFRIDSVTTFPLIITNNHVIRDADSYSIFLTKKDARGNPLFGQIDTLSFSNKKIKWQSHPDKSIDLCATPLVPIINKFSKSKDGYYFQSITDDDIPTENELSDLKGIEDVFMIGYPIGLWDYKNNLPIIRKGITASHPYFNFQNKPIFLIDAACFPGSSGSPILIINEGPYSTKTSLYIGPRRLFLGILYGGPSFEPDGKIKIIDIPTVKTALFVQNIPISLGYCIKSNQVLAFKKMYGF